METLWLLAKINTVFQITEKICYGALALYGAIVTKRYIDDYKMSLEEEKRMNGGM